MKVISFCNQKGGVGKTTSCINLGHALSLLKKKILLIDLDLQGNLTSGLGIRDRSKGIFELLNEKTLLKEVIKKKDGFSVIPSSKTLDFVFDDKKREIFFNIFKDTEFDYILIDTPPSLGDNSIFALSVSDYTIIPVQSEYFALEGLVSLLETVKSVKAKYNPKLKVLGFLITMYDSRLLLSRHIENELRKAFGDKVFKTVIPRNVRLAEAPSFGKSIFEYAPDSQGALSYLNFAKEVLKIESKKESIGSVLK